MKRILISCAALITAPLAVAQTTGPMAGPDGPPVELAGYVVPRDMPIAPPGANMQMRAVPAELAARIINALEGFDYPRCTAVVEDRCRQ